MDAITDAAYLASVVEGMAACMAVETAMGALLDHLTSAGLLTDDVAEIIRLRQRCARVGAKHHADTLAARRGDVPSIFTAPTRNADILVADTQAEDRALLLLGAQDAFEDSLSGTAEQMDRAKANLDAARLSA